MKNIFTITIFLKGLLLAQNAEQIKQAKEIIQRTGMSKNQAKELAKAQGYSDNEIESAIKKARNSESLPEEASLKTQADVALPEVGKSNQIPKEDSYSKNLQNELSIIGQKQSQKEEVNEELSIIEKKDLEVVDESELYFSS